MVNLPLVYIFKIFYSLIGYCEYYFSRHLQYHIAGNESIVTVKCVFFLFDYRYMNIEIRVSGSLLCPQH